MASKMYNGNLNCDQVANTVDIAKHDGSTQGLKLAGTLVTATAAQLNSLVSNGVAGAPVNVTAAGAITVAAHGGRTVTINSAAGIALTLPAATGAGTRYNFVIGTTVTSSSTTITSPASNFLAGTVVQAKVGTSVLGYAANGTSHRTITMDGSTRGGIIGDIIRIVDVAAGLYSLEIIQQATGVVATPIS